jgi:hypothetical protein
MQRELDGYVDQIRDKHLYGHRLDPASTAKTVQVRDGQTLVSDGPFAESKEFVAGFDVFDVEDHAEAVAMAAKHPVSWFHCIEVRGTHGYGENGPGTTAPDRRLLDGPPEGTNRYALFICVDGIPLSDEEEEALFQRCIAWGNRLKASGVSPWGTPLQPAQEATTVRVRDGQTLATDGPFVEAKEFLAGIVVVDVPSLDDAVALAAEHPIAAYHRLEVRPFHVD